MQGICNYVRVTILIEWELYFALQFIFIATTTQSVEDICVIGANILVSDKFHRFL